MDAKNDEWKQVVHSTWQSPRKLNFSEYILFRCDVKTFVRQDTSEGLIWASTV